MVTKDNLPWKKKKKKKKRKKGKFFRKFSPVYYFDLSKHCRLRSKAHYPPDLMGYEHCLVAK